MVGVWYEELARIYTSQLSRDCFSLQEAIVQFIETKYKLQYLTL